MAAPSSAQSSSPRPPPRRSAPAPRSRARSASISLAAWRTPRGSRKAPRVPQIGLNRCTRSGRRRSPAVLHTGELDRLTSMRASGRACNCVCARVRACVRARA
eukprot:4954220-Pleurochrysis_carterae.AAC.1